MKNVRKFKTPYFKMHFKLKSGFSPVAKSYFMLFVYFFIVSVTVDYVMIRNHFIIVIADRKSCNRLEMLKYHHDVV